MAVPAPAIISVTVTPPISIHASFLPKALKPKLEFFFILFLTAKEAVSLEAFIIEPAHTLSAASLATFSVAPLASDFLYVFIAVFCATLVAILPLPATTALPIPKPK